MLGFLGIADDFVMEENAFNNFTSIYFSIPSALRNHMYCNCSFMWFPLWLKEHPLTSVDGFCTNINKDVNKLVTDDFSFCYDHVKPVTCNISHSVEIICTSRYINSHFKHWVHTQNGTEIRKLTGESIDHDTNVLSIPFCSYEDIGVYTCMRTTNYSALAEFLVLTKELFIYGPPILVNRYSVEVGNNLVLSVVFYCYPYSEPDWLLGNTVLSNGSKYFMSTSPYRVYLNQQLSRTYEGLMTSLTIINYAHSAITTFTCRINNGFGEVKETIISRSVNIEMQTTTYCKASATAEIKCIIDFSGALPDSWKHSSGGQTIRFLPGIVANNTNILIIPFCNYQDMGDYTCTWKTNTPGLLFNKTTTLVVNGQPVLLEQFISSDGHDAVLSLFFISQPFPVEPKWYFHGAPILLGYDYQQTSTFVNVIVRQHRQDIIRQGFVSNLTFTNSKLELHGRYTCKIENGFGHLQVDFSVNKANASKILDANRRIDNSTIIIISNSISIILLLTIIFTVLVYKYRKRKEDGYTDAPIQQSSVPALYDSIRVSPLQDDLDIYLEVY